MRALVSLYTGVGGLDLGLEVAGFRLRAGWRSMPRQLTPFALIVTGASWWQTTRPLAVEEISSRQLMRAAGIGVGEAALLAGGPPCQPFSKSGFWATGDVKRLDDPRANTLEHFLRILRDLQPEAYLLENVPGLSFKGKDEGYTSFCRQIEAINRRIGTHYNVHVGKLNAADYGSPRIRERIFLIGHREGRPFIFPAQTHFDLDRLPGPGMFGEPYLTAWDAIGNGGVERDDDLFITGKWANLLPSIPEGQNYLWHTERGGGEPLFGWRTRYWTFLLKLAKCRPAWTV